MKGILMRIMFLLIFLFAFLNAKAQNQTIPVSPEDFREFLIVQGEVPNLGYQFFVPQLSQTDSIFSNELISFAKTDSGFVTMASYDFQQFPFQEKLLSGNGLDYEVQYLVFSQISSLEATYEYLSNLVKNGDFLLKTEPIGPSVDLVSLASYTNYSPLRKFKMRFISDLKILVITVIIGFFFIMAFGMILAMLILKARRNNRENLRKEYDRQIIDPLTSLLFEKNLHEIYEMDRQEFFDYFPETMLSKKLFNEVLIERIIGLNKKMKGEFKDKLKAIYRKLHLDRISIQLLKKKKWDRVTRGLVQINEMDLVEALSEVKIHANSSNFQIRSHAVSTLLNLSEKVDLAFLRDLTFPLSLWQQMNYLRIIKFVNHQKKLNLEILFESKNQSIRLFSYKLVKMLGRVDLIEMIAAIAPNVTDEEKLEIMELYASLGAHMEVKFINTCLRSENQELVLSAAKAAAGIGDAESAAILIELIGAESSFRRKFAYLKSLYDLDYNSFEEFTQTSIDLEIAHIKKHILDPLLLNV